LSDIRVLKFGGSSLASPELIHKVAQIIVDHYRACQKVVVVVSAMGKSTDELISLSKKVSPHAQQKHSREVDMLVSVGERISMSLVSMAIRDLGVEAVSLTGSQSGIITNESHGEAEIVEIKGERILKSLEEKKIVIVAGFQGVSRNKEITTLGRGGSDTTALALASFLKSSSAYIYSDVDAYFSADPKQVKNARRYKKLPWDIGYLSSYFGAKVLHYRAAKIAAKQQLQVQMLSTFNPQSESGGIEGSFDAKNQLFQVLTINQKSDLQKLTTEETEKITNTFGPLEIETYFIPSYFENRREFPKDALKTFFYSFEKSLNPQEFLEKKYSDGALYQSFALVGTSLLENKKLLDEIKELLRSFELEIEAYDWTSLYFIFFTKKVENNQKILLALHQHFIENKI
jgi:aspartate kinase